MKIAGVTMTYNDEYKLQEWVEHYNEYKNELDYYIIVDNGSKKEYIEKLEKSFHDATLIIKRSMNGGCTAAYNDGIRYILGHTDADAIIIIANDFKINDGCIKKMYDYLYSDKCLGIVSTAVLSIASTKVENYGHKIEGYKVTELERGKDLSELAPMRKYTDLVTGGFYMAKREYYENVGLQDENLFMYGDEFDTSLRTKKAGYKIGVTCETYGWHWHINESAKGRNPAANYLIARNRIYVVRKHFGSGKIWGPFWYYSLGKAILLIISAVIKRKPECFRQAQYSLLGGIYGLMGNMKQNKYTQFYFRGQR